MKTRISFPFLVKNSLEIKKRLQNSAERTLFIEPYCKLQAILESLSIFVYHFHIKDVLPKDSALALFIVLNLIPETLFISAKQNGTFRSEQLNICGFRI